VLDALARIGVDRECSVAVAVALWLELSAYAIWYWSCWSFEGDAMPLAEPSMSFIVGTLSLDEGAMVAKGVWKNGPRYASQ